MSVKVISEISIADWSIDWVEDWAGLGWLGSFLDQVDDLIQLKTSETVWSTSRFNIDDLIEWMTYMYIYEELTQNNEKNIERQTASKNHVFCQIVTSNWLVLNVNYISDPNNYRYQMMYPKYWVSQLRFLAQKGWISLGKNSFSLKKYFLEKRISVSETDYEWAFSRLTYLEVFRIVWSEKGTNKRRD